MLLAKLYSRRRFTSFELLKKFPQAKPGDYIINYIIKPLNSARIETCLIITYNGRTWNLRR